jgi:predicted MarR family transcription regulator
MTKNRAVSHSHLVAESAAETGELEYRLFVATSGFKRWIVCFMTASRIPNLSPLDVMVLHRVNYVLKKLLKLDLTKARNVFIRRVLRARMLANSTTRFEMPVSSKH